MGLLRTVAWGLAFTLAGATVAFGWLPGSASWTTGPRIGIATLLLVTGLTVIGLAAVPRILRATTRPSDYEGGCPVGATCACGHFNFKPRTTCRQCGAPTRYAATESPAKPTA